MLGTPRRRARPRARPSPRHLWGMLGSAPAHCAGPARQRPVDLTGPAREGAQMQAARPPTPPGSLCADAPHADEFYALCGRTRLMLAREFESFGAGRDAAAASAQDLLDRLVTAFFARGTGLVEDRNAFADGVIGALGGRLGGRSERVWSYIVGGMLPHTAAAFSRHRVAAPGGRPLDAPFPPGVRIRDLRDAGFFGSLGDEARRGPPWPWPGAGAAGEALARNGGVSPIVLNLLALSSYRPGGRARAAMLGRMLEMSMSDAEGAPRPRHSGRKREGAFYTPPYVARHMCRRTIIPWLSGSGSARDPASLAAEHAGDLAGLEARLRRIQVLDPACGPGAFLIEAAGVLLDVHGEVGARGGGGGGGVDAASRRAPGASAIESVWGCLYGMDKSPRSVEAARLALLLAAPPAAGMPPPDLSGNIVVRDSVANLDGGWDAEFPDVLRGGGFDVIVGNPPYVRHEELRDKVSMDLPDPARLGLPPAFRIPRKSDLGAYFHYHSLCNLAEGGRLAFIASDGWLSHGYGLPLQRALLGGCRIDAIVRPTFNVFGDADIKTAVLFLARLPARRGHRMRFASIARPCDLEDWGSRVAASPLQESFRPGNWSAQFAGEAPAPRIPMTTASSAGRAKTCVKTGNNGFFVLAPDAARERGIAGRFLRPVLSRGDADGCMEGRDASEYLFAADMSKGELLGEVDGVGALRYIEEAEETLVAPRRGSDRAERRMRRLASVRGRALWYSLGLWDAPPPIFLSIFTYRRMGVYRNDGRFFARNNFAAFAPSRPAHADALCAYFAAAWFALHMERNGHVAGGGALQFLVGDFARSPVPDLNRMGRGDVGRLAAAWDAYCAEPDRGRLDDDVLEVMGFGASERAGMVGRLEALISSRTGAAAPAAGAGR